MRAILFFICLISSGGGVVALLPAQSSPPSAEPNAQSTNAQSTDEPALPPGLDAPEKTSQGQDPPALPPGLGGAEPALPSGLGGMSPTEAGEESEQESEPWLTLTHRGFFEMRAGTWLHSNRDQRDGSAGEQRAQFGLEAITDRWVGRLTLDLVSDSVATDHAIDLEAGDGFLDLREASLSFSPWHAIDVRAGRQVLTWGTGDLVFINDLFPKDFQSFFLGREPEYLKAPSDAVRVSAYHELANVDLVYTPLFDPDRSIDGSRISYFSPSLNQVVGRSAVVNSDRPEEWFDDDEWAMRVYRTFSATEVALYGYFGRWKSPVGFDPARNRAIHPRLFVTGASARTPLGGGVGQAEFGFYDSLDDRSGTDPNVPNGQLRALAGYEREIGSDRTLGGQVYVEHRLDHSEYRQALSGGAARGDRDRVVVTARLTQLLLAQNLELSFFAFYSPTDQDAYLRPKVSYAIDDHFTVEVGGSVFVGEHESTFFGQFEESSSVYAAVRFGF